MWKSATVSLEAECAKFFPVDKVENTRGERA